MRIQRLRTRIAVFFIALLGLVQLAAFALVNAANSHNAHAKIEEELGVGQRVFARLLTQNAEKLSQAARVLAGDFAFREAVATHDVATITSALQNHGARVGAGVMLFVDLDGRVIADTNAPQSVPRPFEYPRLLRQSKQLPNTADLGIVGGNAYQLGSAPVLTPLPIGWIIVGLPVDNAFARDLRQLTSLDVSFLQYNTTSGWRSLAATIDPPRESELLRFMPVSPVTTSVSRTATLNDVVHQIRIVMLSTGDVQLAAVLHRSQAEALAAFAPLRTTLLILAMTSLALSICGSFVIALNITRPLSKIAGAAERIQQGDYSRPVEVERADEIGVLASSLNHMREGIAEREHKILTLAYHDSLTGLANRSRFSEDLEAAIREAQIAGRVVSILLMDLDRFKYVNDALGHSVGDHTLEQVARRIEGVASKSAACIARLGGDEFAVLLTGASHETVRHIARSIITTLESPILYEGQPLDVGTSIGIAHYPEHGADAQTLLRNADIAMYAAKRNKSSCQSYDPHYDTSQKAHLSLLGELRRAVEAHELRLYYQPKVSLHSSNVNSVEALLRWQHPQRGMVSPALFIPFAEHTGYIKVLTQWVLNEAIRQCGAWCREGLRLQISVNISARDLMNRELPDIIADMLRTHDVPAGLLCLEITESGFMEDPVYAQKVLDRLAALGLRLAIDDYGTGYSSLSYIMKLPVQELKIDRSFISRMVANADSSTIVRSTIELGHSLGMKVVAEGVEDLEGWNLLRSLGCDDAQGYYMSPPLPADELVDWMHSNDAPGTKDAQAFTPATPFRSTPRSRNG